MRQDLLLDEVWKEPDNIRKMLIDKELTDSLDWRGRIMVFSVDNRRAFILRFHDRIEQMEQAVEKQLEESLQQQFGEITMFKAQNAWCVCLPAEQNDEMERLRKVFNQANQVLTEKYNLTVSAAVSSQENSLTDASALYTDAARSLSHRFVFGSAQLITSDTSEDDGSGEFSYPEECEKKLIACLQGGNLEKAIKAYESFVSEVRLASADDACQAFVSLHSAIARTFGDHVHENPVVLQNMDELRHWMSETEMLEEANHLFVTLIQDVIANVRERSMWKHKQIVEKAQLYIAAHYDDITLCMNDVAKYVGMSAAYLGRIFRQQSEMTFSDYLMEVRLQAARELILNTDKTITEISGMVGFTNSSYFYIVFKKHMNCTPSQYRQQNKGNEQRIDGIEAMVAG